MNIDITNNELIISISTDNLIHAITHSPDYGLSSIEITDKSEFLQGILEELLREDETGATPVHEMFDKAANLAIENGCEGVKLGDY